MEAEYDRMAAALEEAEAVALRCGDPEALLEVRRYQCRLLMGSPHLAELERIARRSFDAALQTGNAFRAGIDVDYLVTTAMARGDRAAVESLLETEFRRLAERDASRPALRSQLTTRAAIALAEGRFDDAKRLAANARDSWRADFGSSLMFGAQVGAARLEQGRQGQLADALGTFLAGAPRWLLYQRTLRATALAELGRGDEARRELAAFDELHLPARGWTWPFALRYLAESTALLGDEQRAVELVPRLEPYAGQLLVAYDHTTIEGSADRARGQIFATLRRLDEAVAAYQSGLALEQSFGAPALAARTRYWLARALAARGNTSDAERARIEAEAARAAAHGFGMVRLADQAGALAASLR